MKEELWAWWEFSWETLPLPVAALFIQEITLSNRWLKRGWAAQENVIHKPAARSASQGTPTNEWSSVCVGGGSPTDPPPCGLPPRALPTGACAPRRPEVKF